MLFPSKEIVKELKENGKGKNAVDTPNKPLDTKN